MICLFTGSFIDVAATVNPVLSAGNYAIDAFMIDIQAVSFTAANGRLNIELDGSTFGAFFSTIFNALNAGVGSSGFNQLPARGWQMSFPKPLILPRGDAVTIKTSAFSNISQFNYSLNLYGNRLP
jgi:hypothetical protein